MTLEQIKEMWSKDCIIDDIELDKSSLEVPKLHAKYSELLTDNVIKLKNLEFKRSLLMKDKWLWYNGKMDQETIVELGWDPDPFNGLKIMKGDMDYYYDSDPEIQKSEEKIQYYKTLVETLTEIVSNLNWRHQTIGNIIRWKQFESGS